ncbi:cytochrome b/b6 domain-containing protein [Sphingosinicella rhizophila]|uniref:Cytochrome b/b6 domain-containing protein n=1 Tax=Sphingosinicella rhizophila TaxID=3050082 RepID=A0ABU3QBV4_9SPHN|nr:cytochrome b/b6 domain-containing protein [Sphingosinicella sp. GR2756]MDT9600619.1 cytochrome b/b6 domain-containing protein [Sphingosinicella sp. GR2756]
MASAPANRIAIWDWPVRICHWLFVLLIPLAWWTAEEHMFDWHLRVGMLMLLLLVFRLIWGLIGSSTARFADFLKGPGSVLRYVRGGWPRRIGHNPLGGWSVAALLGVMMIQVGLGLFATDDDGLSYGPLNHFVSYETAEQITELHEANFNILLALIAVHIGAILFYALVKREGLVRPMLTGRGEAAASVEPMRRVGKWRALLALFLAWAFAGWIFAGAPL